MSNVRTAVEKAREPAQALAEAMDEGKVKHGPILKAIGVDPASPVHQAMLIAGEKYGLDAYLKQIIVIPGKGIYVTRDGYIVVAHRTVDRHGEPVLDGIVVVEQEETKDEWRARVEVYRKDWSHPTSYWGRYPKNGANKQYGPEMAIKNSETATLRRCFPVAIPMYLGSWEERWDTTDVPADVVHVEAHEPLVAPDEPHDDVEVTDEYGEPDEDER